MASDHHFLISGNAPFSQDGIFEVELAISESKPSDTEIKTKSFSSIWKQNFHLKVKNGRFQETIGSHENPLPDSIQAETSEASHPEPYPAIIACAPASSASETMLTLTYS